MKYLLLLSLVVSSKFAYSMTSQEAIKAQRGCYKVTFKFSETFSLNKEYKVKKPYISGALEWIDVDYDREDEIHLQHILIIRGNQPLKHWRQEWKLDGSKLMSFKGDNTWKTEFSEAPIGSWRQNVYQVDDSPRYSCSAPWVIWGTQAYWECQSWNPLPRREFSSRSDYNVLDRRNRHQLTNYGWVHEQDNKKVIVKNEKVVSQLVKEKGENTYERVSDDKCKIAKTWWDANKNIWHEIQSVWRDFYRENDMFSLKKAVEGKKLWMSLFELAERASELNMDGERIRLEARQLIGNYKK